MSNVSAGHPVPAVAEGLAFGVVALGFFGFLGMIGGIIYHALRGSKHRRPEWPLPTIKGKDDRERILIPAGEFLMGSDEYDSEKPLHKVHLDAFYIDRYTVTNADYKKFVDAAKYKHIPQHWKNGLIPKGRENHPVVYVHWDDAVAYAEWAGGRLPTEAEWEKAARGTDGRRYPWGNEFDKDKCNTRESLIGGTTPVGKYPAGESPYHILEMAGNVWEWTSSIWGKNSEIPDHRYPYRADDGREDMGANALRVLRGGSWCSFLDDARCACRLGDYPDVRDNIIGFRVAESVP